MDKSIKRDVNTGMESEHQQIGKSHSKHYCWRSRLEYIFSSMTSSSSGVKVYLSYIRSGKTSFNLQTFKRYKKRNYALNDTIHCEKVRLLDQLFLSRKNGRSRDVNLFNRCL